VTELGQLADTGASVLLRKAASILIDRGLAIGVTRNIQTGEVDLWGALLLASGVKVGRVNNDTLDSEIPTAWQAAVVVAWEALDWACGCDPITWQDTKTLNEVLVVLNKAATRLDIALR
jgi:hypothetical protein